MKIMYIERTCGTCFLWKREGCCRFFLSYAVIKALENIKRLLYNYIRKDVRYKI